MKKKLLALALTTALLGSCMIAIPVQAENIIVDGCFTFDTQYGIIKQCNVTSGEVVIPEEIGGIPVTELSYDAFNKCYYITSVYIPKTVRHIGVYAYDTVATFSGCNRLQRIETSSENEYLCSVDGVLFNKEKTELICYPCGNSRKSYSIPEGVTRIWSQAFGTCSSLKHLSIPKSLTEIEAYAFSNITTNMGITDIYYTGSEDEYSFKVGKNNNEFAKAKKHYNTNLKDSLQNCITLDAETGIITKCDPMACDDIVIPEEIDNITVSGIGDYAFCNCTDITSLTLPENITNIGNYAFAGCTSLTNVNIPHNVTYISENTFRNCSSLKNITIPNSITNIGKYAFYNCYSLESIENSLNLKNIDCYAFAMCNQLKSIDISNTVETISNYAFAGCSRLSDVHYSGSQLDWPKISIGECNSPIENAIIHYNYTNDESSTSFEATRVGSNIIVATEADERITNKVLHIAIYNSQDALIDYMVVPTSISDKTAYTVFKNNPNAAYAKMFVWDSLTNMIPEEKAERVDIH